MAQDDQVNRPKPRRLKKWLIIISGTSLLLVYGFFQMLYHLDWVQDNGLVQAMEIAIGISTAETGFQPRGEQNQGKNVCKYKGEYIRNYFCLLPVTRPYRYGCARWRLEGLYPPECILLEGHAYLLSQPKAYGAALHALEDPCHYLPSPEEVEKNLVLNYDFDFDKPREDRSTKDELIRYWKNMGCSGSRKGYTGKLTLSFYNEEGDEVRRIVRYPKE